MSFYAHQTKILPQTLRLASQKDAQALATLYADMDDLLGHEGAAVVVRAKIPAHATTLTARTLGDIPGLASQSLETDDIVKVARKMGFDGVVFQNVQDSPTLDPGYAKVLSDIYVAFEPHQIRHVPQPALVAAIGAKNYLASAIAAEPGKTLRPT